MADRANSLITIVESSFPWLQPPAPVTAGNRAVWFASCRDWIWYSATPLRADAGGIARNASKEAESDAASFLKSSTVAQVFYSGCLWFRQVDTAFNSQQDIGSRSDSGFTTCATMEELPNSLILPTLRGMGLPTDLTQAAVVSTGL